MANEAIDFNALAALAAAAKAASQAEQQPAPAAEPTTTPTDRPSALDQLVQRGFTKAIATYQDGQILENPETGERAFVSPGYVTQDQQVIAGMMEGTPPSETQRGQMQEQIIAQYPVASRAATALQAVPFVGSYTDEAVGLVSPAAADAMTQAATAVQERRPGQALALAAGGTLAALPAIVAATPAAVGGFVGGATSMGGQMLRAALLGATGGGVEGTVSGYGRGEGETRVSEAASGGLIGTALGGFLGGAMPLASAGVRSAWQNIKGRSVGQIAKSLNISTDAAKVVRTALENDDLTAAAAALDRAGSTSMLADAGPGTQRLLDASVTYGGTAPRIAGEAVTRRAEDAGARMTGVMDNILGAPEGVGTSQRGIRQGTAQARNDAYRIAYAQPIDYAAGRGKYLETLLSRVPKSAVDRANELMRLEGVQSSQILAEIAQDGSVTYRRLPDVRQLDYITRAMGDVAEAQNAAGKLGGTTQLGRATSNLQKTIRDVLKREVPAYGTALDVASDAISRVRAVELGADILRPGTTREFVRDALKGASKAERDAAKAGFRSAIDDALARVNAVASDPNIEIREFQKLANNLRSRSMREKMETLLGPKDADALYSQLDENVVALELRAAISRNSATAGRKAIQETVEGITSPSALSTLMAGEPVNATKRVVQVITGTTPEARTLRQMGIYDEIAATLVNLRGPQAQMALKLVQKAIAGDALTETQARIIAKSLTTPAATALYGYGQAEAQQ